MSSPNLAFYCNLDDNLHPLEGVPFDAIMKCSAHSEQTDLDDVLMRYPDISTGGHSGSLNIHENSSHVVLCDTMIINSDISTSHQAGNLNTEISSYGALEVAEDEFNKIEMEMKLICKDVGARACNLFETAENSYLIMCEELIDKMEIEKAIQTNQRLNKYTINVKLRSNHVQSDIRNLKGSDSSCPQPLSQDGVTFPADAVDSGHSYSSESDVDDSMIINSDISSGSQAGNLNTEAPSHDEFEVAEDEFNKIEMEMKLICKDVGARACNLFETAENSYLIICEEPIDKMEIEKAIEANQRLSEYTINVKLRSSESQSDILNEKGSDSSSPQPLSQNELEDEHKNAELNIKLICKDVRAGGCSLIKSGENECLVPCNGSKDREILKATQGIQGLHIKVKQQSNAYPHGECSSPSKPVPPTEGGLHYDFEIAKEHLQTIFNQFGVGHDTIMIDHRLRKITVVGENTSTLVENIKKNDYLKHFSITNKEFKGEQIELLSSIEVGCVIKSSLKCELFLKEGHEEYDNDYYAFLPAHLFLSKNDFNQKRKPLDKQLTFSYPDKTSQIINTTPTFLYCHKKMKKSKVALDIAVVDVTEGFCSRDCFARAKVLHVTKEHLDEIAKKGLKIFKKGKIEIGHVVDSLCETEHDGHFWIKYNTAEFKKGDCGTIMYLNDNYGNEYMLGMLRLLVGPQKCYGATVLSHNIEQVVSAIPSELRPSNLQTLDNEEISIVCNEKLLLSLK